MHNLNLNFNEETKTHYLTYNELDLFIMIEKLNLMDWFSEIVYKNGGEITKSGEDFYMEEEAYDALEEIEKAFESDGVLDAAVIKLFASMNDFKKFCDYLTMFKPEELQKIIKKSLPYLEG